MMGGWGYGYGFGMFHMFIGVIVLLAIIAGVVWLVRTVALSGTHQSVARRSPGLDVLEERYARGELKRDEYLEKKAGYRRLNSGVRASDLGRFCPVKTHKGRRYAAMSFQR